MAVREDVALLGYQGISLLPAAPRTLCGLVGPVQHNYWWLILGGSCARLKVYADAVDAACCADPRGACADGLPTACGRGCAAALLPMQRTCADFLVRTPG